MSMFVLFPDVVENGEWTNLITNFAQRNPSRLLNSTEEEVDLFLPKFRIATEEPLNDFVGMVRTFWRIIHSNRIDRDLFVNETFYLQMFLHNDPSDFSGVFNTSAKSNLGEFAAKLVIKIDEEGTEAAAASGQLKF